MANNTAQHTVSELPTEIIDNILRQIGDGDDTVSFSRTCRTFHNSFAKTLLHHIDIEFSANRTKADLPFNVLSTSENAWTSSIRCVSVDQMVSRICAKPLEEILDAQNVCHTYCQKDDCRACTVAGSLCGLDAFLRSQMYKVSKKSRSLTFRGTFGRRTTYLGSDSSGLEHTFLNDNGLAAFAPQRFEFNMCWRYWDMAILNVLSLSQLVDLKLPLGKAADCEELGRTLVQMPMLKSLTITDMPDQIMFLKVFPFLGLGIRSRSATLRNLDLSLTNCNRPDFYCDSWRGVPIEHEPFVKPPALDYFFGAIFPMSLDDISEDLRLDYHNFDLQIKENMEFPEHCAQRLKLESLRLKRIDLPSSAFDEIIDGTHLRELRLPFSDVDPAVWKCIGTDQLKVLEEIDYELLCQRPFEHFLHSQTSLQSLSFARPPDQYRMDERNWYAGMDGQYSHMRISSMPPSLSQATAWTRSSCFAPAPPAESPFPTLDTLLRSLSRANIEQLLLPADLYDITPEYISSINTYLPSLQHLTWGFDYKSPSIRKAFSESFLPNAPPSLRKITFLSLHLPSGYDGTDRNDLAFNAPDFHDWIATLGDKVPGSIRYVRYRHLLSEPYRGERQRTTVWYHRREPVEGGWWIELGEDEGEGMFEEERTPLIWGM